MTLTVIVQQRNGDDMLAITSVQVTGLTTAADIDAAIDASSMRRWF
jgi:hypothetical protein